jgi:hypothetical protein
LRKFWYPDVKKVELGASYKFMALLGRRRRRHDPGHKKVNIVRSNNAFYCHSALPAW